MTREEKIAAAKNRLESGVAALVSSDDWVAALRFAAKFHRYSFRNQILIATQASERGFEATRVAGYRKWQELGRQVRKGETGLAILAPSRRKTENAEGETEYRLVGFRAIAVFDVSQTDGDPLPETPEFAVELTGDDAPPVEPVAGLVEEEGFEFDFGDAGPERNGYTSWADRRVVVDASLEPAQAFKTAVHEAAHVLLHDRDGGDRPDCRGLVEVEAESVAFVVSEALGLDAAGYSFGYVAGWAASTDDEDPVDAIQKSGDRIVKAAGRILETYERKEAA
jgi:antirestriction protein ArdC